MDTCGHEGSIALLDSEAAAPANPILASVALGGRSSSERLMPELRAMMAESGWQLRDVTAIGVVAGPGSFTGVRVGVAAAKGLCEAADLPLVMVSRLAVLAHKAGAFGDGTCAVLDAGRGEFFYGSFGDGESAMEALLSREAVLAAARGGTIAVCEESVRVSFPELQPAMTDLSAADAFGLVSARVERRAFDDVATSDANYLRRTDLEVQQRLAQRVPER